MLSWVVGRIVVSLQTQRKRGRCWSTPKWAQIPWDRPDGVLQGITPIERPREHALQAAGDCARRYACSGVLPRLSSGGKGVLRGITPIEQLCPPLGRSTPPEVGGVLQGITPIEQPASRSRRRLQPGGELLRDGEDAAQVLHVLFRDLHREQAPAFG